MEEPQSVQFARFERGRWDQAESALVRETPVRIHVNGRELATLMCTPSELDFLALGFLCGEGIIQGIDDVRLIKACPSGTCVDVWLRHADIEMPRRRTITSGCGGGVTFADLSTAAEPLLSDLRVMPQQLCRLMEAMQTADGPQGRVRGLHMAALASVDANALLAIAEDVGRHNTMDKLWGRCLVERIPTEDRLLLSTGRISSEMLYKAARMKVPVIATHTSPTSLSISLAKAWQITLVGYVRRDSLNVYTGRERIT